MKNMQTDPVGQLLQSASTAFAPPCGLKDNLRRKLSQCLSPADASRLLAPTARGRRFGLSAAAAAAVLVVAALALWPSTPPVPAVNAWWQGPPSAWAQEIAATLQAVESVTCRETWFVRRGSSMPAPLSDREYGLFSTSRDSYRRDRYWDGELVQTQWYAPSGDENMCQTDVHYDERTYRIMLHDGNYGDVSPLKRMTFLVRLIDRADTMLGTSIIDGHECVGFEISEDKYGDNPPDARDRIWFDVVTRLPVCVEYEHMQPDNGTNRTFIIRTQDNFDWAPNLTADYFQPVIPDGFVEKTD